MADTELEKTTVYLAYRNVFKDKLAKLRKRKKIRDVVEKHPEKLIDAADIDKTCRILRVLLAARLFESDSAAEATFPALFSSSESGKDNALIRDRKKDGFHSNCGQIIRIDSDSNPSRDILCSLDTALPTGCMDHPQQATNQIGKTKKAVPKDMSCQGTGTNRKRSKENLEHAYETVSINNVYLPFRLQHLIVTRTQALLEECCYNFAKRWLPSTVEANGWDAFEAVELTHWWKTLSKSHVPATAIDLSQGQPLIVLFKRVKRIRHSAVHRRPQIAVKQLEEMVRDAWLLSLALRDDLRAAQLLFWHQELESLVAGLELKAKSRREAAEAELQDIHRAKIAVMKRLAELESRASQLTQSLEAEGNTKKLIDIDVLRPLEEALNSPALTRLVHVTAHGQAQQLAGYCSDKTVDWSSIGGLGGLAVKASPPCSSSRDQSLLLAPVNISADMLLYSHESFCGHMDDQVSWHKRRKYSIEANESKQEVFQGSSQASRVTTRSMTRRHTAVRGEESSRSTGDAHPRPKSKATERVSEYDLHPAQAVQPQPHSTAPESANDDNSTDYGSVPPDYDLNLV